MAEKEKLDLGEEKKNTSKALIFIVLGAVLGTLIAVFGALYFMGLLPMRGKDAGTAQEARAEKKAPLYLALEPPFVINFRSNPEARLLQVEINVASTDPVILDAVKKHTPIIRNDLLLLLSGEDPSVLKMPAGKEELRGKIKELIKKVVVEQTDKKGGVDDIFFTGFIMQ